MKFKVQSMATIKSFEDLIAWQKARAMNVLIYKLSGQGLFSKDFSLKDQIRRASISVMSNIAEGFERNGNKEFIQFLSVAKASNAELRSQLFIAMDLKYINKEQFDEVYKLSIESGKIINGFMEYLKTSDFRGNKFAEEEAIYLSSEKENKNPQL